MHFDKKNDCVQYHLKEVPQHRRRAFITFYFVNFLLLTNTHLDLPYEIDSHMFCLSSILTFWLG